MAKKDIFLKMNFKIVDEAYPDFELLALKFSKNNLNPSFRDMEKQLKKYQNGLFILRSVQCPYTEKNVNAIIDSAKNKFGLKTNLVDLTDSTDVQNSPCAFGSFCIILDGEIISFHPISNTRFENILNKKNEFSNRQVWSLFKKAAKFAQSRKVKSYIRRINIQHRVVYQIYEKEHVVKIIRMWTHYE